MVIAFPSELKTLIFKGQYFTQVPHDIHLERSVTAVYVILDNSLNFFCKFLEADVMIFYIKANIIDKPYNVNNL